MRIALICPYNYFRPGGVQICITELAHELESRGHYVRIIAPIPRQKPKRLPANLILLGGSAELNTPFHTKVDVGVTKDMERIDNLFRDEKFDVVHLHEPGMPVFGVQMLGRSTAANVATMHATLPDGMISKSFGKLMTPIAKFIEPRVQVVTAVSEIAKEISLNYAPNLDIRVIPNGIRLSQYRPAEPRPAEPKIGKKTILYVGRLERRKGAKYLIEAYAELRKQHQDVRLILAGDGRQRERLEALVAKHEIPDVKFLGFVSEAKKIQLLQRADLYCSPALFGESFGIVLLEAMAAEAVTVAGDNPGYRGVMTGRGHLSLVDPTNVNGFAGRLELLLYDAPTRQLWLDWARDYVKQFDYPKITDLYLTSWR